MNYLIVLHNYLGNLREIFIWHSRHNPRKVSETPSSFYLLAQDSSHFVSRCLKRMRIVEGKFL